MKKTFNSNIRLPGWSIFPGDVLFGSQALGFVLEKKQDRLGYVFVIRWTKLTEHLIEMYTGPEIVEEIEAGSWSRHNSIKDKKSFSINWPTTKRIKK